MNTKSLVHAAMIIAIYLVFLILYTIGILPSLTALILPIPIIIYSQMSKKLPEISLLFLGCCIGAFLLTSAFGLFITIIYGLSGLILGWGMVKKWPYWQCIVNSALVYMFGIPLIIYLISNMWITDLFIEIFTESFEIVNRMMPELSDQIEIIQNQMTIILPLIIPTLLLLSGMTLSFLSDRISKLVLHRLKFEVPQTGNIGRFQLGRMLAIIYIVSPIFVAILNHSVIYITVLNLMLLLNILFAFQGTIILFQLLRTRTKGIITWIILSILVLYLLFPLSILGVMDAFFNYRNRFKGKKL